MAQISCGAVYNTPPQSLNYYLSYQHLTPANLIIQQGLSDITQKPDPAIPRVRFLMCEGGTVSQQIES